MSGRNAHGLLSKRRALPEGGRDTERRELGSRRVTLSACLPASHSNLFEDEPSGQGKAGALWETAFPLLRPLPSPRSTPSFGSRIHSSRPGFGFAFRRVLREPPVILRDGRWNAARLAGRSASGGSASRSSRRLRRSRTLDSQEAYARSSLTRQARFFQRKTTRSLARKGVML